MADLKTPPCNLGAAKFSSISADTALNRPVPELTRNRLGLCLREDLTESANRVLRGDLFVKINHDTQADSIEQILNQFELFPDVESKICTLHQPSQSRKRNKHRIPWRIKHASVLKSLRMDLGCSRRGECCLN